MTGRLLTLLHAPTVAAYTAAGWWGAETIYRIAARHAHQAPEAFAVRDRSPAADLSRVGRGRRPARRVPRRAWRAARPARRGVAAEPGRDRGRAAGLLAQRLCLLPVACTAATRWTRSSALIDRMRAAALIASRLWRRCRRHDIFAALADRDFLRYAYRVGPAEAAPFADLTGPAIDLPPSRDPNQVMYLPFTSGTTGDAEGRHAQRQHAARNGADDGARLAAGRAPCSTR